MGLALDEPKGCGIETINGVEVLLDDDVKPFTDNQTIDYVTSFAGSGFVIANDSGGSCC